MVSFRNLFYNFIALIKNTEMLKNPTLLPVKSCLLLIISLISFLGTAQSYELPKNFVKVSVLPIFVGEVNFNYERILSKKLSAELGAGFVTNNYIKSFLTEQPVVKSRQTVIGPSFAGLVKYYPFSLGDELYLCAEFKYRRYRANYNQDGQNLIFKEYTQRIIPRVGVGYHYFLDEHMFIDFSGSLGLIFDKIYQFGDDRPSKTIKLNFGFGMKFGYAF